MAKMKSSGNGGHSTKIVNRQPKLFVLPKRQDSNVELYEAKSPAPVTYGNESQNRLKLMMNKHSQLNPELN